MFELLGEPKMIRSKIRFKLCGVFLVTAMGVLPLAGCRTRVIEHDRTVVQPVAVPDHHNDDHRPPPPPDRHDDHPDGHR
jgi:hypothetical protein